MIAQSLKLEDSFVCWESLEGSFVEAAESPIWKFLA